MGSFKVFAVPGVESVYSIDDGPGNKPFQAIFGPNVRKERVVIARDDSGPGMLYLAWFYKEVALVQIQQSLLEERQLCLARNPIARMLGVIKYVPDTEMPEEVQQRDILALGLNRQVCVLRCAPEPRGSMFLIGQRRPSHRAKFRSLALTDATMTEFSTRYVFLVEDKNPIRIPKLHSFTT